ncbi:ParB/RepB/Spo0J family partition protein [Moorella sp. Hama-1]|uniref:ParB/RepB/Spo0J family partition protein n=1 Tax=Moorella sp. Hama-1 TaxID=2138101 RepID=UPI000D64A0B9|nr:ParB/RepB/Spo0J family partition protein [Moorella sp. Hama-1]MDN5361571.1 ParB family transcriptional regulator, chromosome partitioning protein [Moorella sp. (in: firmicutes)]BCV23205.1 chromosome partitioning protein ParB [Moorella sp. Hama-1]
MAKRGLGRGLEALLPQKEIAMEDKDAKITSIAVDRIEPGKHQPRRDFDDVKMAELAQSIKAHGIIQPIVVKPAGNERYEIIAGERRWRACRQAGLQEIPAIIKSLDARTTAEIALVENLQREDLNPLEEAEAYQTLLEDYGLTQEDVAGRVGKSRPVIANALRLLQLPEEIKGMLRENKLSSGHARALLGLKDKKMQVELAKKIVAENLSVRETENIIKKLIGGPTAPKRQRADAVNFETHQMEERLQQVLSTRVKLKAGKNSGKIEIYYFGPEDLERIITVLTGENVSRETF